MNISGEYNVASNVKDWLTITKSFFTTFSSVSIAELDCLLVCWEDEQYFVFSKFMFKFLGSYVLRVLS